MLSLSSEGRQLKSQSRQRDLTIEPLSETLNQPIAPGTVSPDYSKYSFLLIKPSDKYNGIIHVQN